jgi:hypothetical protein
MLEDEECHVFLNALSNATFKLFTRSLPLLYDCVALWRTQTYKAKVDSTLNDINVILRIRMIDLP